jgi:hypothetical protein
MSMSYDLKIEHVADYRAQDYAGLFSFYDFGPHRFQLYTGYEALRTDSSRALIETTNQLYYWRDGGLIWC